MPITDYLQPLKLIEHARGLAGFDAGRGRPRQADLRRAVSAAYYAVYHDISLRSALQITGNAPSMTGAAPAPAVHMTRWFTHGGVVQASRLAEELVGAATQGSWKPAKRAAWELLHAEQGAELPSGLVEVAQAFRLLQEQRHTADYDHVVPISRQEARGAVDSAAAALAVLQQRADEPEFRGFLTLVALCTPRLPAGI